MLPDWVSNLRTLTLESHTLLTVLKLVDYFIQADKPCYDYNLVCKFTELGV